MALVDSNRVLGRTAAKRSRVSGQKESSLYNLGSFKGAQSSSIATVVESAEGRFSRIQSRRCAANDKVGTTWFCARRLLNSDDMNAVVQATASWLENEDKYGSIARNKSIGCSCAVSKDASMRLLPIIVMRLAMAAFFASSLRSLHSRCHVRMFCSLRMSKRLRPSAKTHSR